MSKYSIFIIGLIIIAVLQIVITGVIGGADILLAVIAAVGGAVFALGLFAFIMHDVNANMETCAKAKQELERIRREQDKIRDKTVHPAIPDTE